MIRDRGIIKWNSMMLPEHVTMLREWTEEDSYKKEKQMDEQTLELLNEMAQQAIESEEEVIVYYFANHQYEKIAGRMDAFDPIKKAFRLVEASGEVHWILAGHIKQILFKD